MPLIEKEDKREQELLRIRLTPVVAEQLKAYEKFADSSDAHIVNAALQRLFAADKEFKEFLDKHPDAGKPEAMREDPTPVRTSRKRKDADQTGESASTAA